MLNNYLSAIENYQMRHADSIHKSMSFRKVEHFYKVTKVTLEKAILIMFCFVLDRIAKTCLR